ncbi:MAG: hypothetical protein AAF517_23310 [Planctomycetota bacterium]
MRLHGLLTLPLLLVLSSCSGGSTSTNGLTDAGDDGDTPVFEVPAGEKFNASTITQHGVTWEFDGEYPAGRFANGDYWVVGPVTIVRIDPPSVSGSRIQNGSQINPVGGTSSQGFDNAMDRVSYDEDLNVAVDLSASSPLVVEPGSSLLSTRSYDEEAVLPQLDGMQILTVLAEEPPDDAFRPAYCGSDKSIRFRASDLDTAVLLSLPRVSSTPEMSVVERYFERPWMDHLKGWSARYSFPNDNMPDYGREMSHRVSVAALILNMDFTDDEKSTLLISFVQLGIDLYGIVENGGQVNWKNDGGHSAGRKWPILFAGIVLNDPDMLAIGSDTETLFGEDGQTFYVAMEDGEINDGHGGYTADDVGMAEWGITHSTRPHNDNKSWGTSYRQCCTAVSWSGWVLAARMMDALELWNHDALFDYQDRYMETEEGPGYPRASDSFLEESWDTYRSTLD